MVLCLTEVVVIVPACLKSTQATPGRVFRSASSPRTPRHFQTVVYRLLFRTGIPSPDQPPLLLFPQHLFYSKSSHIKVIARDNILNKIPLFRTTPLCLHRRLRRGCWLLLPVTSPPKSMCAAHTNTHNCRNIGTR